MNSQIVKINGLKEVEGMKFHDIEGGFGEGKKAMLVKEIAEIHGREEKHINELINNNIKRFNVNIDIVNLLSSKDFEVVVDDLGLRTSNRQKYSYLLSERGYSKLLKILEDDVAWEQYEKLVDGYFNLRSELPQLSKELQAIFALDGKQQKLESEVKDLKDNMPLFQVDCKELQAIVRKKGIEVLGGKDKPSYKDNSIRGKVYSDIQHQLKREFGVTRYEAIKRSQLGIATEIINNYKVPTVLAEEIEQLNNQIQFN
ncbi:MAG: ORF6C domain-containing protein [Clostridium sp.]|uniref:ORF6C domain-containing protein n=1 Tax=Clostridium sp. TaxID=1506 RepID=UPI00290ABB51|nr:ORF6C domain-containing protein [Clostridium sp.]MDU4319790.1 ORF6C domain-containing protein [Clostridium sp.]